MSTWRESPPPIPVEEIRQVFEANVVVVGLGYAGSAAMRAAAESGASTIGLEHMKEEKYNSYGRDIGHINSKFLESRGVPKVDPIDFHNEWMRRSSNRANPSLIMKFAQKSGETFDWYTDMFGVEGMGDVHVAFWPCGKKFDGDLAGYKFWSGTAQFPDPRGFPGFPTLSDLVLANIKKARETGAEAYFGIRAVQPVMDGKRVIGVIGKDRDGNLYQYNGKNGVILATGDFSGNREMLAELVPDIDDLFTEEEGFKAMGRKGRGIQMGVWAGGRLEARPLPTMGGNHNTLNGLNATFGILWLDTEGKRYCNETFGDPVFAGFPGNQMKRGKFMNIFDANVLEDLQWAVPAHGGFDESNNVSVELIKQAIAEAPGAGTDGYTMKMFFGPSTVYGGNTIEQLADNGGITGEVRRNMIKSFRRYNEICGAGRDDDFGKDAKLLRPLDKPPFLLQFCEFDPGFMLVTVGGLLTDENQNVLNDKYERIPGLYASGNCCGRRFGPQYSTPIAGVSIGICIVLGREAGIAAATMG